MIIPVWKNIGQSTHQLAKQTGEITSTKTKNPDDAKATHTGTLDPMAEGVVIVLTGADRFKKNQFSNWKKTYEFEVVFGVSTDTHDLLGLQTQLTTIPLFATQIEEKLHSILPKYIGTYTQLQPKFSAQRINGKSAFDYAKKREIIPQQRNTIIIDELQIIHNKETKISTIQDMIFSKIKKISGDFRQSDILQDWNDTFTKLQKNHIQTLPVFSFTATVSKRTYIRALVRDITQELHIPGTTASIIRTQNGEYTHHECNNH